MIDVVEADISRPADRVAALQADPTNSTKWMHDVERVEFLSGATGAPGSRYRLIPKKGSMVFVATVVAVDLPRELQLKLDAPGITVSVRSKFESLPDGRTRLCSEEHFLFHGLMHRVFGLFARPAIRNAHRTHMEAFRQFAEQS